MRLLTDRAVRTSGLLLAGALVLGACGGYEEPTAAALAPPVHAGGSTADLAADGAEGQDGSDGADDDGTDDGPDGGTDDGTDGDPDDGVDDGEARSSAEPAAFEVTWPAGWVDFTFGISDMDLPGVSMQMYGQIENTFSTNGIVGSYAPENVGGVGFEQALRNAGTDVDALRRLPSREVDGITAIVLEGETMSGSTEITQRWYGLELSDGGIVEIVFSAEATGFEDQVPMFEEIVDSVVVHAEGAA